MRPFSSPAITILAAALTAAIALVGCATKVDTLDACLAMAERGLRPVSEQRSERFLGKVREDTARCRGGDRAVAWRSGPWLDWQSYWATGDARSLAAGSGTGHLDANGRGIDGALLDLEYQRIELIKFNLFDTGGTYPDYVRGRAGVNGRALKVWPELRLPKGHPLYEAVGGDNVQLCHGEQIRFRQLTGVCNDIKNPLMGSSQQPFVRNVQFEATFPDLGKDTLARNRHGDRLGLLNPDPQVISRTLFTRAQSKPELCHEGHGLPGAPADAQCDYKKAPFFNVLAAFWIQFMTHDWFAHLQEGQNGPGTMAVGCASASQGCRPGDRMDPALVAESSDPARFSHGGKEYLARPYRTSRNNVTAWWDASQIYGHDETSRRRVKRAPDDPAKLLLIALGPRAGAGERQGYLPLLESTDPMLPQWAGQEAAGFPDNWTIGMSFYHTVFAREHNLFVEAFRAQAAATPDGDSGLRNPDRPGQVIRYRDVTPDELFEVARLVVSTEIAKIHTTEWTPQLLYDEPLYLGMNANWHGLFRGRELVERAMERVTTSLGTSTDATATTQWYSVFASGPGIFGLGSSRTSDGAPWSLANPEHVNGGVNHFGSPFNFPEEFVTVYRLHTMVPDLLEYRQWDADPNVVRGKIPVVDTFRARASQAMRERGLASWALSMGRQRLGALTLQNHPQFLQNLELPRLQTATGRIDVAALDLIRDREHGVPRFNEFRRQYGLRQLTSFDDFVDTRLTKGSPARAEQERLVGLLRQIYGQHRCDASKVITDAQVNADGSRITDCLGHPNGSLVDNIEDVDTVVGWLAEFPRPHGFAISETQFQVFILNASRRLFSDRFFTSSFRPEFYTHLGVQWVNQNGPDRRMEKGQPNGHEMEVSPLKRVLLRTIPELAPELDPVVNAFDPWARDRGAYYSLDWKPRPGAEADAAFKDAR
jgi:hypothetical protein